MTDTYFDREGRECARLAFKTQIVRYNAAAETRVMRCWRGWQAWKNNNGWNALGYSAGRQNNLLITARRSRPCAASSWRRMGDE